MGRAKYFLLIAVVFSLSFLSMANSGFGAENTITVMTHDSFSISKKIIAEFEKTSGIKVKFLKAGDTGAALNQAILSKNNPLGDIFFGIDNTFLGRALKYDIFEPYKSPALKEIPDKFKLDPKFRMVPVDFGDVCINYDKKWFEKNKIKPPKSLENLTNPQYKGLVVVENPATSSPGLAFLLATIGHFGEKGYLDFWKKMRDNDVLVASGWKKAYWGHFTAASKGNRPIVISYATSPAAEVYFAVKKLSEAPTAAVIENESVFRQIEFAGILKNCKNKKGAEKFIDFMLSVKFQEDIPLKMFVFPVNKNAKLPRVFLKYAVIAKETAIVSPEKIDVNREKWIQAWTKTVLR